MALGQGKREWYLIMKNNKGETIVEALVSILLIALCFVALQTSIVSSGKINAKAKEMIKPFVLSSSDETINDASITIKRNSGSTKISIDVKKTANGYYYY